MSLSDSLPRLRQLFSLTLVAIFSGIYATASVIGTNPPAQSLTRIRIAQLPASDRNPWITYISRSEQQRQADKDAFQAELKRAGIATPIEPPHSNSATSIPLDRDATWYASAQARHIADVIISFQTQAGGWSKNLDMSQHRRQPGERYGPDNLSKFLDKDDFDIPAEPDWNYIGTIDNDATSTQLNFLARAISAAGAAASPACRAAFLRGINYLFAAQYPNGGWPQVWPLEGGYHDAITFNDNAMTQVMELMQHVAQGQAEFAFVPRYIRRLASTSFSRGLRCTLRLQLKDRGKPTVWAQQYDALTLEPTSARNYEPPAPSTGETTGLLLMLMNEIPDPTPEQQQAIRSGINWLRKTAIYGQSWERTADGRMLVAHDGAGPIWARYYLGGEDIPIFSDRDKTIHDSVAEISAERRNGYAWYTSEPRSALDRFDTWTKKHPETK